MQVKTWNSDKVPAERTDDALVHNIEKDITIPHCGATDEVCCGDGFCSSGFTCESGKCKPCGAHYGKCCHTKSGDKCNNGLSCHDGSCLDCSALSAPTGLSPDHHSPQVCLYPDAGAPPVPLSWSAVSHATGYEMRGTAFLATPGKLADGTPTGCWVKGGVANSFGPTASQDSTPKGFFINADDTPGPQGDRIAEWQVRAVGECGQVSPYSGTAVFTRTETLGRAIFDAHPSATRAGRDHRRTLDPAVNLAEVAFERREGLFLFEVHALLRVILGEKNVDRRHDEQREQRADGHPAHQHDADRIARDGARRRDERQRKVAATPSRPWSSRSAEGASSPPRALRRSCSSPFSCCALANSTIRMPFFETRPTSVTSPTCE